VYLRADDTGPAVKGDHIDIAVKGHSEALSLGVQTADIWWCEE
jgi:3D (Asp-Asp-Asp) domain-containing protein